MLRIAAGTETFETEHTSNGWMANSAAVDFSVAAVTPGGILSVLHNGKSYTAYIRHIDRAAKLVHLTLEGFPFSVSIKEPIDQMLEKLGMNNAAAKKTGAVKAPMPGLVLQLLVSPGQAIKKGDPLLILEAMKMENVIKAAGDGVVKSIAVQEKTAVEKGAVIIELE